jgi:hypothetical protein
MKRSTVLIAGARDYDDGIRTTRKLINWVSEHIQSVETLDGLRTALDSCPPTSRREERIILFVATRLPQLIRAGVQIAARKAAATIPAPKGGRPAAIAPEGGNVSGWAASLTLSGRRRRNGFSAVL